VLRDEAELHVDSFAKKAVVDSTDERNMMDIMFYPEDSQWRKWAGLVCHRSRSMSFGHCGKQGSR
jgi:hypothetical protein